jgi:hypothetical protein
MDICYFCNSENECQLYKIILHSAIVGEIEILNDRKLCHKCVIQIKNISFKSTVSVKQK